MARRAILAVAAAVVLLGTVQIAARPDRVPDAPFLTRDDGTPARMPGWATVVMPGALRRHVPLSTSVETLLTGISAGEPANGRAYWGGSAIRSSDLAAVGVPYTQIVISPALEVLVVCRQTVVRWVPPCLLDGTSAVD